MKAESHFRLYILMNNPESHALRVYANIFKQFFKLLLSGVTQSSPTKRARFFETSFFVCFVLFRSENCLKISEEYDCFSYISLFDLYFRSRIEICQNGEIDYRAYQYSQFDSGQQAGEKRDKRRY